MKLTDWEVSHLATLMATSVPDLGTEFEKEQEANEPGCIERSWKLIGKLQREEKRLKSKEST